MTLNELLFESYGWADQNAGLILLGAWGSPSSGPSPRELGKAAGPTRTAGSSRAA